MEGYKPKIPTMNTVTEGDVCAKCSKKVYFNERVKSTGKFYHKACFHCFQCNHILTAGQECPASDGAVYCKTCYQKKYGPKGFSAAVSDTGLTLAPHGGSFHSPKDLGISVAGTAPTKVETADVKAKFAASQKHLDEAHEALGATTHEDENKAALDDLKKMMEEMEKLMTGLPGGGDAPSSSGKWDDFLSQLDTVRTNYPENRTAKYLTRQVFNSFSPEQQEFLYRCAKSGVENPDSSLGCYAMRPNDYREFSAFFDPLIRDYHKASKDAKHITDWDASAVGENGVLDVTKLGLSELSMRVRVGRNLKRFNLPGAMDKVERIAFEKAMLKAFDQLIAMPEFGGRVYSLTPDFGAGEANPNLISEEEYQQLVDDHVVSCSRAFYRPNFDIH
jgi:hypothetical protein